MAAADGAAAAAAAGPASLDDLMPQEDDLLYEEELLRNPYSLSMWCRWVRGLQRTRMPGALKRPVGVCCANDHH